MEIIEEEVKEFCLVYEDANGDGYSFPCDEEGHILWEKCPSPETTQKSLAKAKAQDWTGKTGEVVTLVTRNRYGICQRCGRRVYLGGCGWAAYMGLVECECGQWYNIFGQAIKPPDECEEVY